MSTLPQLCTWNLAEKETRKKGGGAQGPGGGQAGGGKGEWRYGAGQGGQGTGEEARLFTQRLLSETPVFAHYFDARGMSEVRGPRRRAEHCKRRGGSVCL